MSLPVHREIPDGLNHKTGLKRQGLAPAGEPVALYEYRTRRGYERCPLYAVAAAIPLDRRGESRARKAREAAREARRLALQVSFDEELAALEQDALAEAQRDWRTGLRKFGRWAADPNMLIVDTETTGLSGQVIEIAVVTLEGKPLLNTLVRATVPIKEGAHRVHSLSDADLLDAPTWPETDEEQHEPDPRQHALHVGLGAQRDREDAQDAKTQQHPEGQFTQAELTDEQRPDDGKEDVKGQASHRLFSGSCIGALWKPSHSGL